MNFINKFINPYEWKLAKLRKRAQKIISMESKFMPLSDEQLKDKTNELRNRVYAGEPLDSILEEAYALVREGANRSLGMKHFEVQIMAGIAMHEGNIAEMKTGEGKTLVATLPAYLNALTGDGVFVITANDYLAQRDREEMGKVYEFLGLSVGLVNANMNMIQKKIAYGCDITYGTHSEFGFDYLKDNMAVIKEYTVQSKRNFAIIDEVDSILIDEARTPLIISGIGNRPSEFYVKVDKFAKSLESEKDYEYGAEGRLVHLTDSGMDKAEEFFELENITDASNAELLHHIRQGLSANYIMKKDQDYVVKDGEIVIVDQFTGRLMEGRTYSNGLHQAVEAKEDLNIKMESKVMATITYQNYFKMFNKLAGMTGTAFTEKNEFVETYGMDVVQIPTNKPIARIDNEDMLFLNEKAKMNAVVEEVAKRHETGQPVLVGTIYIDKSEEIGKLLEVKGVPHRILNAKQDANEAEIISQAGQKGSVTIATNMAGRGTDIKLGDGVKELGGLCVIGTERHESRRIDNQLRGRSGRQGDPGESRFYVSFEDSMFERIDADQKERMEKLVSKITSGPDQPVFDTMVSKSVENVQNGIEAMNFRLRKATLEYDQILNKQRETIYGERNSILNGEDKREFVREIILNVIDRHVERMTSDSEFAEEWNLKELETFMNRVFSIDGGNILTSISEDEIESFDRVDIKERIAKHVMEMYEEKEERIGEKELRFLERLAIMKTIDAKWVDHIDVVSQLRTESKFAYLGQNNPIRIFNEETYQLFEDMLDEIKLEAVSEIFATQTSIEEKEEEVKDISEKERIERIEMLQEKYKVERKRMPVFDCKSPVISFKMDINAVDEVEVTSQLYYMESGFEQKLKPYRNDYLVNSEFEVILENKFNDKVWPKGWYQLKVFIHNKEVSRLNFMVGEKAAQEPPKEVDFDSIIKSSAFYANDDEAIDLKIAIPKMSDGEKNSKLVINENMNEAIDFTIPAQDGVAHLRIEKGEEDFDKGLYKIFLEFEERKLIVYPFVLTERIEQEQESLEAGVALSIHPSVKEKNERVRILGKLENIDDDTIVATKSFSVNQSGKYKFTFYKPDEGWKPGRYSFTVTSGNNIIAKNYYLVK